jgi:fibrillarin-like rRNA methylase
MKKLYIKTNNEENISEHNLISLNPYTSKLAAALFNGLEIFPIQSKSLIFLDDNYSEITLEHISKIITTGKIFLPQNLKNKKTLQTKNIKTVPTLKNTNNFLTNNAMVDTIFLDSNENENIFEQIKNYELILKQHGFLIFLYNFQYNKNQNTKKEIQNILDKLKETFQLVQEINLSDFFKSSFMIIMTKI